MHEVPNRSPEKARRRSSIESIKELSATAEGKRFIRDSLSMKPVSSEKRKREEERMRKSFKLDVDSVANLRSCLAVKRHKGHISDVKWKGDTDLVQTFEVAKIRASCWDDCFFTEDELAEFKYQAFMEECGLDPSDFE